jgi:hypothetical protein
MPPHGSAAPLGRWVQAAVTGIDLVRDRQPSFSTILVGNQFADSLLVT